MPLPVLLGTVMPWPNCPVSLCSTSLLRQEPGGDSRGFLIGSNSSLSFSFPPGDAACVDQPSFGHRAGVGCQSQIWGCAWSFQLDEARQGAAEARVTYLFSSHTQPAEQRPGLQETALLGNEELFSSCEAMESFQEL